MPETVSRSHSDAFLKTERQMVERLRAEMGSEVVAKFDRLLLRDLIYERKERALEDLLGQGAREESQSYRVMINMEPGKQQPLPTERPATRREQRRYTTQMQRAGQLSIRRLEEALRERDVPVRESYWLTQSVVVDLTSEQLEHLASRRDVRSLNVIKLQNVVCLDVSRPLIGADQVENNLGFDGTDINVAVIDTGVDATHPALTGVVVSQQDCTGTGIGDSFGHGTHCAGIIASQDRTRRGIAPGARIWDIKIMDANGNSQPNWAVCGLQAAVAAGVNVASNSWGWSHANGGWTDTDCNCVLCTAADNAVAAGVVIVVAAGNEDNDTCSTYDTHIRCPGNGCRLITVGASDDSDNMADFSSIGPTPDGRTKPDITAPGVNIGSARASGTSMGSPIDANWTNASGTSMACPHIAGVAALMLDKNSALTPANVQSIMMATAVNIGATPNEMGAGRVDALAAVNAS